MRQARAAAQLHPHLHGLQRELADRVRLWRGAPAGGASQEILSALGILLRVSSCLQM